MSQSNGVIRVGRKGLKKFAFGDDGQPFVVDVIVAFQEWIAIDKSFRDDDGILPTDSMAAYHQAAVQMATSHAQGNAINLTVTEALEYLARLREEYDALADFTVPRLPTKQLPSKESEVRFSHSET